MGCIARETYEHGNSLPTSEQTLRGSRDAEMPIVVTIGGTTQPIPSEGALLLNGVLDSKPKTKLRK